MITVINYANGKKYEENRKISSWTAEHIGKADKIIELTSNDIPKSYKCIHKSKFSHKLGAGLWLWKPFIINETLKNIKEGDWLFYLDSGTITIRKYEYLVNCAEKNNTDIMLFEQTTLDRQFSKRENYLLLGISDYDQNQCAAGYILIKKNMHTVAFVKEWLDWCEKDGVLDPKRFYPEIEEFSDFVDLRPEQSILTLLRIKYKIAPFRDPSNYGEFGGYYDPNWIYSPKYYQNSDYPTILLSNRKQSPIKYYILYQLKRFVIRLGLTSNKKIITKKLGKYIPPIESKL